MTSLELRRFLSSRDLRGLREGCGFARTTVAAAVGVPHQYVAQWERRRSFPSLPSGKRYARIVAGMERHLGVTWDDSDETGEAA